MKNVFKNIAITSLLVLAILFSACQSEFEELPNSEEQTSIKANSTAATLIKQATSNDGSFDNIVDGSSCIAIQFPYSVKVNGIEITLDSIEDLELIEDILDELDGNSDLLDIIFPIKITLADFTEITINSINDLEVIVEDCLEGGDDDDIECIDFVYPINFFTFDINNQRTGTVKVESDKQLRRFFNDLEDDAIVSIDFPVELKLYDGTKITVNNNRELEEALNSAKNACDEDDDNDYNDDDFDKEALDNYLAECTFIVREVKREGNNLTEDYFEYTLDFNEDGSVITLDRLGGSIEGIWSTKEGDNGVVLTLNFNTLADFSLEWTVYEFGKDKIKLYINNENKIILNRNCEFNFNIIERLTATFKECNWDIKNLIVANDSISGIDNYQLNFKDNKLVTLIKEDGTESEGTWEIKRNEQNILIMDLDMPGEPNLSLNWSLREVTNDRALFRSSGSEGYELSLERDCDDSSKICTEAYISDVLQNCKWKITNEDGTFFQDLEIDFSNRNIHVHNPNGTVVDEGNWELFGTKLRFNNLSMTLANYIGDWDIIECGDGFFKIKRGEEIIKLSKVCD